MGFLKTAIVSTAVIGGAIGVYTVGKIGIKGLEAKDGLKFNVGSIKPNIKERVTILNALQYVASSIPMRITALIKNATNNKYNIQQLFIEVYTLDDKLIASQDRPMSTPIVVLPNQVNQSAIDFTLNPLTAATLLKGVSVSKVLEFLTGGKIGKEVRIKGLLRTENFSIPLDEIVKI